MNSGERERHARTSPRRSHAPSSNPRRSLAPVPSIAIRDCDLAFARSRSTLREIAPSIVILRSDAMLREIVIDGAVVELELAKHRAVEPSQASSVNLGFVRVFWVCLFLVVFSKHHKIFFGKFFEIQSNT